MNIDVKKLRDILVEDHSVSFGSFDLDGKPAIGVLFCLPEQFPIVEKFTKELIEQMNLEKQEEK